VWALVAVRLVDESIWFLVPGNVEPLRHDLGAGYGTVAAMFAVAMVTSLAANAVVAATDGRSRKPVTVAGTFVVAAALAVQAGAPGPALLLVGGGLLGIGTTWMVSGAEIAIANSVAERDDSAAVLPRLLARVNLLGTVGDFSGPVLVAAARAAGVSWRVLFLAVALAVAGYATVLAAAAFPAPARPSASSAEEVPVGRQVSVWLLGLAAMVLIPLDESYLATVLGFAERERGFSPTAAALVGIAFVVGGLLSDTVLVGWVARSSAPRLLVVTGAGAGLVMLVAALAPGWTLVPLGIAHSALLGAAWLSVSTATLLANPGREGRTRLVIEAMEFCSLAVFVPLGIIADRAGVGPAMVGYAVVPLGLVAVGAALGTSADNGRDLVRTEPVHRAVAAADDAEELGERLGR
jgi:MFS family permease